MAGDVDDKTAPARVSEAAPELGSDEDTGRRWPRLVVVTTLGVLAGLVVVAAVVQLRRSTSSDTVGGFAVARDSVPPERIDEPAPDFRAEAVDPADGEVALADYRGKVVVVNIWASWCAVCRAEQPGLVRVDAKYRNRGVQFLGVDVRDSRVAAQSYEKEFSIEYPSAFDPPGRIAADYKLAAVPGTYVIDRKGRIVYRFLGGVGETALASVIDEVLAAGRN